jgi:hypothetical protein
MKRYLLAGFTAASLLAPGIACADQPHMHAALHDLQAALAELQQAETYGDHGGYAGAATNEVQQAIANVRTGIEYNRANGN